MLQIDKNAPENTRNQSGFRVIVDSHRSHSEIDARACEPMWTESPHSLNKEIQKLLL
jgi:hypothetical protein